MKRLKHIYIVLFSAIVLLTSCIKDKQDPPANQIPLGTVYTIEEVVSFGNGYVFDSAASVFATVTMDESNGNLNKIIYVQDSTAGISLTFADDDSNLKQGDYLRIYLNGLTLTDDNGMFTLETVDYAANVILISKGNNIQPVQVSISDLLNGGYTSQLIELVNVEFQDTTVSWADPLGLSTQNRTLQDCGNITIIARTSGYATFAGYKVPSGNGSLVAIAGLYGSTYQLYVRSIDEVDMRGERCSERIILSETFASGQGNFTIQNVQLPSAASYVWSHDASYVCMKASCYVSGSDYASESWLISPAMDFSRITAANFSFEQAINYLDNFSDVADFCSILVSSDYINGNPEDATWTVLDVNYPTAGSWNFMSSGSIDLSNMANKDVVRVAFRYTSVQGDAPTWEVKNVSVIKSE